jgi:hypothetical protein
MNVPHIRIEIDDIGKAPAIYINGKLIKHLIGVHVDWNTADQDGIKLNSYGIEAVGDNGTKHDYGQRAYPKL